MIPLEKVRIDLDKMAEEYLKKGDTPEVVEEKLFKYILELKKSEKISIPDIEELFAKSSKISERLKMKVQELQNLTSNAYKSKA